MLDGWSACRDGVNGEDVSSGEVRGGDVMGEDVRGGDVMGEAINGLEGVVLVWNNLPEVGGCSDGEREDAAKFPSVRFSRIFLRRSLNEPITTACDLSAPLLDGEEEAASNMPADATLVSCGDS